MSRSSGAPSASLGFEPCSGRQLRREDAREDDWLLALLLRDARHRNVHELVRRVGDPLVAPLLAAQDAGVRGWWRSRGVVEEVVEVGQEGGGGGGRGGWRRRRRRAVQARV